MVSRQLRRSVTGGLLFLLAWQITALSGLVNPMLLPTPAETFAVFAHARESIDLLISAWRTLVLSLSGFVVAALMGVVLGVVVGWFQPLYETFELVIEFFRSLPAAALLPPILLFFGIGSLSKIVLVCVGCGLVILLNTAAGVKNRNQTRVMVAKIQRATSFQMLSRVVFPDALPTIVTGLRISMSLSLVLTVVAEMFVGTDEGLGRKIVEAQELFRYPEMYAAIFLAGIMGFSLNKGIVLIANRYIHWAGR